MRNVAYWLWTTAMVTCGGAGLALAQDRAPAPEQAPTQEQQQAIAGLELEGELKSVDPDKRFFLLAGDDGTEMLVYYDDQTKVVDESEGVQGLAGQVGTRLRVEYRAEGARAIAERISVMATDAEAPTQQPPPGAGGR